MLYSTHLRPTNNFKVVATGGSASGRSVLLHRLESGAYQPYHAGTVGVDFLTLQFKERKIVLWDIVGNEQFIGVSRSYLSDANAAIVTIDCTDPRAFENANRWVGEIHCCNIGKNIPIILAITKADIAINPLSPRGQRVITLEQVLQYAHQTPNIAFVCETSAKNDINVSVLEKILKLLLLYPQKLMPELLYFCSAARPDELQHINRVLLANYPYGSPLASWAVNLGPQLDFA